MSAETAEQIAVRVIVARSDMSAIDYGAGFADKEYPEIVWSICGLPETNEIVVIAIVVIAEVGRLKLGKAHQTSLAWPAMVDRIFRIDVDDQKLALRLSAQLLA